MSYNIGDTVQLNSGSNHLTIIDIGLKQRNLVLQWLDKEGEIQTDYLPSACVKLI